MNHDRTAQSYSELDAYIEAYEADRAANRDVDLVDYLPPRDDPLYREVLIELIRVDVEWRHKLGEPCSYEIYCRAFSELERDSVARELIEFEEERAKASARETDNSGQALRDTHVPGGTSVEGSPIVPGYHIESEIGRGGMGIVYKAQELQARRPVAIKTVRQSGSLSKTRLRRFQEEAEAVGVASHPNIVQLYHASTLGSQPYLVLEYVDGGTLTQRAARRPPSPREAARLIQQMAKAMSFCHLRHIAHRDLKPSNILIQGDPDAPWDQCEPKITDFGLVKWLTDDKAQTRDGTVLGTPAYMAPEQARGEVGVGAGVDIYALGSILFELLTGRPPFRGGSTTEVLTQVLHKEPPLPSEISPSVPKDLQAICLKCLQKAPEDRYLSASELAQDLGHFLRGEPIAIRWSSVWERGWKWAKRRPAVASLSFGLFLAVCALLVGGVIRYREMDRENARMQRAYSRSNAEREIAIEERKNAEVQREKAESEKQRATKEHERAEQNLAKAHRVISESFTKVGRNRKLSRTEKEKALAESLGYLKLLLSERGNTEATLTHRAFAYASLARLEIEEGSGELAGDYLDKAASHYSELVKRNESEMAYRKGLADALFNQGRLALREGRIEEAQGALETSFQLRKALAGEQPKAEAQEDLGLSHLARGDFLVAAGKDSEAEKAYREAQKIFAALKERHSEEHRFHHYQAMALHNLGLIFSAAQDLEKAEGLWREAQAIWEPLLEESPDYRNALAATHDHLGLLYEEKGLKDKAVKELFEALALREDLKREHRNYIRYQRDWAQSQIHLGNLYQRAKDPLLAEAAYIKARAVYLQLAHKNSKNVRLQLELAGSHNNLGALYSQGSNQLKKAEATYQKALDIYQEIVSKHPGIARYDQELAGACSNLGLIYARQGENGKAKQKYDRAMELYARLIKDHPDRAQYTLGMATARLNLAHLFRAQRKLEDAIAEYDRGEKLLGSSKGFREGLETATTLHQQILLSRATALVQKKDFKKALADWELLLERAKDAAPWPVRLGKAATLAHLGRYPEAVELADAVLKNAPQEPACHLAGAGVYSLAFGAVQKDRQRDLKEREKLATRYRDKAMHRVNQALAVDNFLTKENLGRLETDLDLRPLRRDPGFQELLEGFRKRLNERSPRSDSMLIAM